MINEQLPGELAGGHATALGAFVNDELVAVCAWTVTNDPLVWHSAVTGVAHGFQNRGYASVLKADQMERAFAAGAQSVRARVHRDNHFMLQLYRRLGATVDPDPDDPEREYRICEVSWF